MAGFDHVRGPHESKEPHTVRVRAGVLASTIGLIVFVVLSGHARAGSQDSREANLAKGREVAFDRTRGNCLSCHYIEGGEFPGNGAPPLLGIATRFSRESLRSQIYDPTLKNPDTVMPPFGLHRILDEDELDQLVDYILSL